MSFERQRDLELEEAGDGHGDEQSRSILRRRRSTGGNPDLFQAGVHQRSIALELSISLLRTGRQAHGQGQAIQALVWQFAAEEAKQGPWIGAHATAAETSRSLRRAVAIAGDGSSSSNRHGRRATIDAAARGDAAALEELIRADGDAASVSDPSSGVTPLMAAAKSGHCEVVRLLLNAGAPWNALDRSGRCAGDYAMDEGHQDCYDLLLDAGVKAELVLGAASRQTTKNEISNKTYLDDRLRFSEGKLVNRDSEGVMMAWEKPLMEAHAKAVCCGGGDILNVGFGMGLVDAAIQSYKPSSHTIIEAHPNVHARMIAAGWGQKENVRIVFGRWQDVLPELDQYDGIFFDTYGEYYEDMREFHSHLPRLLKPGGIYSYFNGLCGHNAFFHVVYCQLVALELAQLGLSTQFIPLPVKNCLDEKTWEGVRDKYWQLDTYFLPAAQAEEEETIEQPSS